MAAAYFHAIAEKNCPGEFTVSSAGLKIKSRLGVLQEVEKLLQEESIHVLRIATNPIGLKQIRAADLVICMTNSQCDYLQNSFPSAKEKIRTLMSILGSDKEIFEPAKLSLFNIRRCFSIMRPALTALFEALS